MAQMKLLIVENPRPLTLEHCNDVANAPLSASLNSGYALAVARAAGWDTAYLDFTASQEDAPGMAAALREENADIILCHWVYSWGNEAVVRSVFELLHRDGRGPVGAFGLFPTLAFDTLATYCPHLDFIIVGEFEQTLAELLDSYQTTHRLTPLPGIYQRGESFLARTVIPDPSHLPVPDDVGANCAYATLNIAASRGCFGDCAFCFINGFYGCSNRRERSIASLERELEIRLKRRSIRHLYFVDPTFIGYDAGQKERARTIGAIVKNRGLTFGFETRVDTVDAALMADLAKSGATSVFLGIESGCDAILRRIGKRITRKDILTAVRSIRASGMHLTVGFIMFEPDSTLDELGENFAFLEELGLLSEPELTMNMLYHSQIVLAGSKAWRRFAHEGRLLVDEKLPFEANYLFKHANVARVCSAMKKVAAEYFLRMNALDPHAGISGGVDGGSVNQLLKDAFRAFVTNADSGSGEQYRELEELFVMDLRRCFLSPNPPRRVMPRIPL